MNVNFNVEITSNTEPQSVIAKLKEIREGLKLSGILSEDDNRPRKIKVDSEERELRKEWTRLTGKPRYKVSDIDKLRIEQGIVPIEEVLKNAIANWKMENPENPEIMITSGKGKVQKENKTSKQHHLSHY
jgi:hypothetical protein